MVIAETAYLLDRELGPRVEALLYESILDRQLRIEPFSTEDWQRIRDLVVQYADMRLGGTDAGLVAVAERLGENRIATLNHRHFGAVRPGTYRHVHASSRAGAHRPVIFARDRRRLATCRPLRTACPRTCP